MKSKRLAYIAALAGLIILLMIVFIGNRARAQAQRSSPSMTNTPPAEVGAPPDATYGEAIETPNHMRQRLAAEAAESPAVPSPKEYPLADAVRALEDPAAKPTPQIRDSAPSRPKHRKTPAPKKMLAESTPPDSATAKDAVAVSDRWQNMKDTPVEGKDGRVVYADGAGLPTVVCAPLRMCIVELQSGEKLTGEPQIGDSVRWSVEPARYGTGERTTPLIVLKPKAVGLDTNLVITMDRRSYYLRLISSSQDYVAKVSFDYPEDERVRWSEALSKQDEAAREAKLEKEVKTLANSVEDLNIDYRVKGDKSIRPIRVLDDGAHTYLQMNPAILHREAPVLAVIGPDSKAEIVNYRVQGSVYIVDRLFDRAQLILGSGRKARKADIISGTVKAHRSLARNPFRSPANNDDDKQEQTQ